MTSTLLATRHGACAAKVSAIIQLNARQMLDGCVAAKSEHHRYACTEQSSGTAVHRALEESSLVRLVCDQIQGRAVVTPNG